MEYNAYWWHPTYAYKKEVQALYNKHGIKIYGYDGYRDEWKTLEELQSAAYYTKGYTPVVLSALYKRLLGI